MATDPDKPCPHENFHANVEVGRLVDKDDTERVNDFVAEIRVWCVDCDEPFRFIGVPAGQMPNRPMCSVDETELRAPIRPASSDPDFGLGIPGFAIRMTD